MKVTICCIAKCENNYIKEWVNYHLSLGFSHIYIYDNNNLDGEEIKPLFIDCDNVSIINCRGEHAYQNKAYTSFYKSYGNQYDWIAYIDIDEFITFSEKSAIHNIDEFLCRFDDKVEIIHLNWMNYGDNDHIDIEDYNVLNRFLVPLDYNQKVQYDFPENYHVKSIIKGGLDIGNTSITVHTPKDGKFIVVDASGNPCENDYFKPYDYSVAYIRHYVTKTIYEWLLKISRGLGTGNAISELYPIDRFFLYNEKNKEKEKVVCCYLMFKDIIEQSVSTDLSIYKEETVSLKIQNEYLQRKYNEILNSKAYKLGRFILHPFRFFKR